MGNRPRSAVGRKPGRTASDGTAESTAANRTHTRNCEGHQTASLCPRACIEQLTFFATPTLPPQGASLARCQPRTGIPANGRQHFSHLQQAPVDLAHHGHLHFGAAWGDHPRHHRHAPWSHWRPRGALRVELAPPSPRCRWACVCTPAWGPGNGTRAWCSPLGWLQQARLAASDAAALPPPPDATLPACLSASCHPPSFPRRSPSAT